SAGACRGRRRSTRCGSAPGRPPARESGTPRSRRAPLRGTPGVAPRAGSPVRRPPCGDDTTVSSLRGQLLIAGPGLVDPNFWRTVVLVGEHSEEGALGVVLNRPSETSVEEAVPELAALADGMGTVHVGGPVQSSAIVVLADFADPDSTRSLVLDSIGFLSTEVEPESLGELRRARVYVGYAGWRPGHLDGQLADGSWIVEPARAGDVFTSDLEVLWGSVLPPESDPISL